MMNENSEITDQFFRDAIEAIDSGNISKLRDLLNANPQLAAMRLNMPTEGYFKHPYLLCFVAENPIRNGKLPANIVDITRLLIKFVRQNANESFQEQIDYTFGLVEAGRIPRDCGVQIDLIDLLMDNGAKPGNAHGALAQGNIEAAKHIIERSAILTLTAAVCLYGTDDVKKILTHASMDEKQVALIAAAFYGKREMIELIIKSGVDVNTYIKSGFHSHASPLHQAVSSGSLESVKLLVQAGASLDAIDNAYNGTPLDWATYMQTEKTNESEKKKYIEIENYLSILNA